jgi:hypothetical protein
MEQGSEFVGNVDDVYQEESFTPLPIAPVRVQQDGPVQVHIVPSVAAGSRSYVLASGEVKRVGNDDPRRRSLTLISDVSFVVGASDNEVRSGYGALWPAAVALKLTHSDEVYVKPTGNATVSAITETWAN